MSHFPLSPAANRQPSTVKPQEHLRTPIESSCEYARPPLQILRCSSGYLGRGRGWGGSLLLACCQPSTINCQPAWTHSNLIRMVKRRTNGTATIPPLLFRVSSFPPPCSLPHFLLSTLHEPSRLPITDHNSRFTAHDGRQPPTGNWQRRIRTSFESSRQ